MSGYVIDPEVKWIWFDLDDTLYDFAESSLIALREMYRRYDLARFFPDPQTWIDIYHKHNYALWDLYNRGLTDQPTLRHERFYRPLREGGASHDVAEQLVPGLDRDYLDVLGATGLLLPGARYTLEALKRAGYHIGILSNGFKDVQHRKLETSGIAHLIDCVVLSDEAGYTKPDRRIFDYALAKAGTTAAESLMIGDNPDTDIAGARAACWHTLLFSPSAAPSATSIIALSDIVP